MPDRSRGWGALPVLAVVMAVPLVPGQEPSPEEFVPPGAEPRTVELVPRVIELVPRIVELERRVIDLAPEQEGSALTLGSDVLFAYGSAELGPDAGPVLGSVVEALEHAPAGTVRIIGHTDSHGDDAYNLDLSQRRAEAVRQHLTTAVGRSDLEYVAEGRGEGEPVAPNEKPDGSDDPAGRQANRRATIELPG